MEFKFDKKELYARIQKYTVERYREALRDVRCPVHDKAPELIETGSEDEIAFRISGCCEQVGPAIKSALLLAKLPYPTLQQPP